MAMNLNVASAVALVMAISGISGCKTSGHAVHHNVTSQDTAKNTTIHAHEKPQKEVVKYIQRMLVADDTVNYAAIAEDERAGELVVQCTGPGLGRANGIGRYLRQDDGLYHAAHFRISAKDICIGNREWSDKAAVKALSIILPTVKGGENVVVKPNTPVHDAGDHLD
jgi:hypothetical protein